MVKAQNVSINSVALFVNMGPGLGARCPSSPALFIGNSEIDHLHVTWARTWEGFTVKSGYIAGICLSKIQNNLSQDSILGSPFLRYSLPYW